MIQFFREKLNWLITFFNFLPLVVKWAMKKTNTFEALWLPFLHLFFALLLRQIIFGIRNFFLLWNFFLTLLYELCFYASRNNFHHIQLGYTILYQSLLINWDNRYKLQWPKSKNVIFEIEKILALANFENPTLELGWTLCSFLKNTKIYT